LKRELSWRGTAMAILRLPLPRRVSPNAAFAINRSAQENLPEISNRISNWRFLRPAPYALARTEPMVSAIRKRSLTHQGWGAAPITSTG
jgi:hypothetical protein